MDKVDATPTKAVAVAESEGRPWDDDAQRLFDRHVEAEPFLVRISASKRLRERVERDARALGEDRITVRRVTQSLSAMKEGRAA